MANEIYDSTWWGNTIDTASSIGTSTEMIQGQFNLTKLGDELITNGDFATDSDWSLSSGSSIANGKLTVDALDGSFQNAIQTVNTTIGSTYKLEFDITEINDVGKIQLLYNSSVIGEAEYTSIGTHTLYFESTNSSGTLEIKRFFPSNTKATIDNVSVKQVRATTVEAVKCLADAIHRIGIQDIQN